LSNLCCNPNCEEDRAAASCARTRWPCIRDISIQQFVEDYIYRYGFQVYPVVGEGLVLLGRVATRDVKGRSLELTHALHI